MVGRAPDRAAPGCPDAHARVEAAPWQAPRVAAGDPTGGDLVEETIAVPGRALRVLHPPDSDALLDEDAFEHEELLPYWAEIWPSGVVLARALASRALRGARTLELGCGGVALPSIVASLAGGRVLATDWSPEAVALAARNAARNGARMETAVCSWGRPDPLLARAPWDLVLAADVLYERGMAQALAALLPRLVDERGAVWIADPGRPPARRFFDAAAARFEITRAPGGDGTASVHRLRLRAGDA